MRALRLTAAMLAAPVGVLAGQEPPAIAAVRIEGRAPDIDGRLDPVWQIARAASGFTQRRPAEGAPAVDSTEVRFLFDDDALYVGARMYSRNPAAIDAAVARRDNTSSAEQLRVSLDPYLDRRTAYTFGVTSAGTRLDWYHPDDAEETVDVSFEPVWSAAVRIDSLGWTAEMRIPFSQLRFNERADQRWGLNLRRTVPARNEHDYWVRIPRSEAGWASKFGTLTGLDEVRPHRQVELVPYAASAATVRGAPDPANPFDRRSDLGARVGADARVGLGSSATLAVTVNPDFGQVEADPAVVNLSAFESFFSEKRPFFTEGRQLLEGNGPAYFYSRRIGGAPRSDLADGAFNDVPRTTSILGAARVTGRFASGTSLGVLTALTDDERVRTFDPLSGDFGSRPAAPLTAYAVARAQQEVGGNGSTVGITATGVRRSIEDGDPLAPYFNRNAVTGGADWILRFGAGNYELTGHLGGSRVEGDTSAIGRVQRSSARYFQRPDADYVELDPARTSLTGYAAALTLAKRGGKHWTWQVWGDVRSPGFELNDAGRLGQADQIYGGILGAYQETEPHGIIREYSIQAEADAAVNYGGARTFSFYRTDAAITFSNYWWTNLTAWVDHRGQSDKLTRGGPLMQTPRAVTGIVEVGNNLSGRVRVRGRVYYGDYEDGAHTYRVSGGITVRPGPRWEFSLTPNYLRVRDNQQYVTTRAGGPAATFGNRYVFATIETSTLLAQFRLSYAFTPDLTLELYAEPFASSGRWSNFGELAAPRTQAIRRYGTDGTTIATGADGSQTVTADGETFGIGNRDFIVRSFRSNAVLRWEWRPGSTLFLVWQQDRFGEETSRGLVGPGALWDAFRTTGDNILLVKASYWLSMR